MNSSRETDTALLRNIETAFDEAFTHAPKAKLELLADLGYDPEQSIGRGIQKINKIRATQRLEFAGSLWAKFGHIIEKNKARFKTLGGEEVRQKIEAILLGQGDKEQIAIAFRDLRSVDDDDLRAILDDAGLLDQLEAFLKL